MLKILTHKLLQLSTRVAVKTTVIRSNNAQNDAGLESTKQSVPAEDGWQYPKEFESLPTAMTLKENMLPSTIYKFATSTAERLNDTHPEYVAMSVLVAAASLAGGNAVIIPKSADTNWRNPLILWGLLVGGPSSMKTPCKNAAMKILEAAEKNVVSVMNKEKAIDFESKSIAYESQHAHLTEELQQYKDSGNIKEEKRTLRLLTKLQKPELHKRDIVIHDATLEALIIRMQSNPTGLLLARDEVYGILSLLIKKEYERDRAFYLEAFEGGSFSQSRVGRGEIKTECAILSILGCIQPDRLAKIFSQQQGEFVDDGLVERLQLVIFPEEKHGRYTDIAIDKVLESKMQRIFECLAFHGGKQESSHFVFDKNAQEKWTFWATKNIERANNSSKSDQNVLNKYPALVSKFAMLLHLLAQAETCRDWQHFDPSLQIGLESLEMAIEWSELLFSHNKKIRAFAGSEAKNTPDGSLLSNLPKLDDGFSSRDVQRKGWTGLKTKTEVESAIKRLVQAGYLKPASICGQNGKSLERYKIHPDFRT